MKTEHRRLCATAKSRQELIDRCQALATELGINFTSKSVSLAPRAVFVGFNYGPYCMAAGFNGASKVGSFLGHWYIQGKGGETFPACFANVNEYHRQKATTCADRFDDFLDCIRRSFIALKG